MFTSYHFIWFAICTVIIVTSLYILIKNKIPLQRALSVACVVCVLSELTKVFSTIKMVPSSDGSIMYPYLAMQHLPLHLCSIQIAFIFYARFAKKSKAKETLLAFMYPTCVAGALAALIIPSIFSGGVDFAKAFCRPLSYQYFIYHAMLITIGLYIPISKETPITSKHYKSTLIILSCAAFASIYFNSIFSSPTYKNDVLVSVDYCPNLFFTYDTPINIKLTELWHWYVYLLVLVVVALVLMGIFYMPFFIKEAKERKQQNSKATAKAKEKEPVAAGK